MWLQFDCARRGLCGLLFIVWMVFVDFFIYPHVAYWVWLVTFSVGFVAVFRLDRSALAEPNPLQPDITLESKA